jgi:hypothetical protein
MPRMTNGIGTWFCKAHFDAGWGWDDAVECAMFLHFPVWAHRALHLREDPGGSFQPGTYQAIPLRLSDRLVRHVLVRRWLAGAVGLGCFLLFLIAFLALLPPEGNAAREWGVTRPILIPLAPGLVIVGLVGSCSFVRAAAASATSAGSSGSTPWAQATRWTGWTRTGPR